MVRVLTKFPLSFGSMFRICDYIVYPFYCQILLQLHLAFRQCQHRWQTATTLFVPFNGEREQWAVILWMSIRCSCYGSIIPIDWFRCFEQSNHVQNMAEESRPGITVGSIWESLQRNIIELGRRKFCLSKVYDGYNYKPTITPINSRHLWKEKWDKLLFLEHWEKEGTSGAIFRFWIIRIGGKRKAVYFSVANMEEYEEA